MEYLIAIALFVAAVYWLAEQVRKAIPAKKPKRKKSPPPAQRAKPTQRAADHFRVHSSINNRIAAVREPRAPRLNDNFFACWVPQSQSCSVHDHTLPGGLLYMGKNLAAVNGYSVEPALINPDLRLDSRHADHAGAEMGYWPSYDDISPASRSAYLAWLAGGREDPQAYIGYVFLFLYGLERRILNDHSKGSADPAERTAIFNEVKRLLKLYGNNGSFRSYAQNFMFAIYLGSGDIDLTAKPPVVVPKAHDLPTPLKLGLGQFANAGKPIPANWAYAWVLQDPEIRLRTPARRCRSEFAALFQQMYTARHGDGLVVKPNKTKVSATYRPASGGMRGVVNVYNGPAAPDITILKRPRTQLAAIADQATDKLDAYSRFIGKDETGRDSLQGLALLPGELDGKTPHAGLDALSNVITTHLNGRNAAVVPAQDLLAHFPTSKSDQLSKKEAVLLVQLLEKLGMGVEPDVRFTGIKPKPADKLVIFRQGEDAPSAPTQAYEAATLVLRLAAMVSAADGEVSAEEKQHLEQHIEKRLSLEPAERLRLRAHLHWLLQHDQGMAGLAPKLDGLAAPQKASIGQYLITVAAADGRIDPGEVKLLQKLYKRLGLDPESVVSDIHTVTAEPITVRPATPTDGGFRIPQPEPESTPAETGRAALDPAALQRKLAETARVSDILGGIFAEPDEDTTSQAAPVAEAAETLAGLDVAHSQFLRALSEQDTWERPALEALAAQYNLLLDGALDTINEAAFDSCDAPVIEDDEDSYTLDHEIYKEMTV